MNFFYHASVPGAKRAPFLLLDGIAELARPLLASGIAFDTEHGEWLTAAELSGLPAFGDDLAHWAPFTQSEQQPFPGDIILCGECTSSLDVAHFLAGRQLLPEWATVLAYSQNAGRGQLRRGWHSPPGNIYAALRLPSRGAFSGWNAALLAGWMLCRAFRDLGWPVSLKWPNDLVVPLPSGRWGKIGGILLEERNGILLAGIGINSRHAPSAGQMRPEAAIEAAVLEPAPAVLPLWFELVKRGKTWYENQFAPTRGKDAEATSVACDLSGAEALLAWKGCRVAVSEASFFAASDEVAENCADISGRIAGLDANGCLLLETDSGKVALMSGSVRLLLP